MVQTGAGTIVPLSSWKRNGPLCRWKKNGQLVLDEMKVSVIVFCEWWATEIGTTAQELMDHIFSTGGIKRIVSISL